jgi:hypothetical protein
MNYAVQTAMWRILDLRSRVSDIKLVEITFALWTFLFEHYCTTPHGSLCDATNLNRMTTSSASHAASIDRTAVLGFGFFPFHVRQYARHVTPAADGTV